MNKKVLLGWATKNQLCESRPLNRVLGQLGDSYMGWLIICQSIKNIKSVEGRLFLKIGDRYEIMYLSYTLIV